MQMEFKIVATNQAEMEKLASIVAIIAAGGVVDKNAAKTLDVREPYAPKKLKAAAVEEDDGEIELPKTKKKAAKVPVEDDEPAEEDDGEIEVPEEEEAEEVELPKTKKKAAAASDDDGELPVKKKGPGRPPKNKVPVEDDESEAAEEEKPAKTATAKYTQDDVIKAFQAKAKKDKDLCYKLLKKYNAVNARGVDPKHYSAVMKELA